MARNKLYKLGFEYKNNKKNVFVNRYKQSNVVKSYKKFLNIINDLKLYFVEFEKNKIIKTKNYLNDYTIRKNVYYFIIIIIYDNCIFFANNKI